VTAKIIPFPTGKKAEDLKLRILLRKSLKLMQKPPEGDWLIRAGQEAEERIAAMDPDLLSPSGRILRGLPPRGSEDDRRR